MEDNMTMTEAVEAIWAGLEENKGSPLDREETISMFVHLMGDILRGELQIIDKRVEDEPCN